MLQPIYNFLRDGLIVNVALTRLASGIDDDIPLVDVGVERRRILENPTICYTRAFIDTGTRESSIDFDLVVNFGLFTNIQNRSDSVGVNLHILPPFATSRIRLNNIPFIVAEGLLEILPYSIVIGRDILQTLDVAINGPAGSIAFRTPISR